MHRYRAFGLSLASDTPLAELLPASGPAWNRTGAVRIRMRRHARAAAEPREWVIFNDTADGTPWLRCARCSDGYLLRYVGNADFTVDSSGANVACVHRNRGVSLATLRHLLLDQVMPIVLRLRGMEGIHATAVRVPGGACAFTGPTGSGKSTLAASFAQAGYEAIADDCLALSNKGAIWAHPAYPSMRLWDDVLPALSITESRTVRFAEYSSKLRVLAPEGRGNFRLEPVPLIRIYRLVFSAEPSSRPTVEPLAPREAFGEMIGSSFSLDVTDRAMLERHFRFLEHLVAAVPMRRLMVPNRLDALPAVREAVLNDLASA